jgi:co-chaperonin GroES (HSP10)
MTVSSAGNLRKIAEASAADPRKAIYDAIGDISGIELAHNLVLVATYVRPAMTQGGIHLPDSALQEDRFQGKPALVLALGPLAFVDDGVARFGGFTVEPGDWVLVRPSDGWEMFKVDQTTGRDGTSCRLFEDANIKAKLADPTLVY